MTAPNLRKTTAAVQGLENRAAEKCGIRFFIMSKDPALMKASDEFISGQIEMMAADLLPEMKEAVAEGQSLAKSILGLGK